MHGWNKNAKGGEKTKDEKEITERLEQLKKKYWEMPGIFDKAFHQYTKALEWVLDIKE